ncbi:MAG: trigger factor [Thermodesulfobacteriota bacterium]|nr:trigger factor [Thermodesulfobacteriota bacterium]
MGFEINDLSKTEKKAKIIVSKSDVNDNFADVVKLFQKDAEIKGFRKGKVPSNVVESMYSNEINEELRTRLINLNLRKLASEQKLNIVRTKDLESDEIRKDQDFSFSLTVEFIPEIKLSKYDSVEVKKEIFSVKKKDIDDAIKNLLENFATNEEIKNRKKVKDLDILEINFSGKFGDQLIKELSRDNAVISLGNKSLIPEIEKELLKMNQEEEKTFDVNYPVDFPIQSAAGKRIECNIKVNKILKRVVPKLDKEFLKRIGFESKKQLEERVKEDLTKSFDSKSESSLRKNLGDLLVSKNKLEFPDFFVKNEEERLTNEYINRMKEQGMNLDKVDAKTSELISESAKRNINLALIFAEIAKLEKISVSDEEIEEVFNSMASTQNVPIEKIKKYYQENNLVDDIRAKLADEKVIKFLISKAKIKEIKAKVPK